MAHYGSPEKLERPPALLDDYSASCLNKAVRKTQELRKRFEGATSRGFPVTSGPPGD